MSDPRTVRIATRESQLALAQARVVAEALRGARPGLEVELVPMTTRGDQVLDRPLAQVGGKGLFVKELEAAMLAGRADLAVHSLKDVPMVLPPQFALMTFGEREVAHDAFVSNRYGSLAALPAGARVGTSSLRRVVQLLAVRPDLRIEPLRGNLDTRLRKLDDGDYDAIVLAAAGLKRLGLRSRIRAVFDPATMTPAAGQGALGIECRADREDMIAAVAALNDDETARCVRAERAMSRALAGSCNVPLGAHARIENGRIHMAGFVASPDGTHFLAARADGGVDDPERLGEALARELYRRGAAAILASLAVT